MQDVDDNDFYKAENMAEYLEEYVNDHEYSGVALAKRIQFGAEVNGVEEYNEGWRINFRVASKANTISSQKLIVATGSTSVPNMPALRGQNAFEGPIIHTLDYGRSKIFDRHDIKSVAVIGGGKSAADMVYQNIKLGRQVSWIIRSSGKGPGAFLDVKMKLGSVRNAADLAYVRFAASLLAFPGLQPASYWQSFLYTTRLGAWVFRKWRNLLNTMMLGSANYDNRPGAKAGFKDLKSSIDAVALESPTGIKHHEDFWDVIAQNVDVYRVDIDHLEAGKIVFMDGGKIEVDAILCGTGFKDTIPFFTEKQCIQYGLPHSISAEPIELQKEWAELNRGAQKAVDARFYSITPPLATPPTDKLGDVDLQQAPFRLYNCIAPITSSFPSSSRRNLAFVGFATLTNMFASSELCAIYATAYLDGTITLPSEQEVKKDIAYVTTYMRTRCPTYGRTGNYYICDFHQFIDRIMDEVGLSSYRKGWWKEGTEPLVMSDLRGLRREYIEKYSAREERT